MVDHDAEKTQFAFRGFDAPVTPGVEFFVNGIGLGVLQHRIAALAAMFLPAPPQGKQGVPLRDRPHLAFKRRVPQPVHRICDVTGCGNRVFPKKGQFVHGKRDAYLSQPLFLFRAEPFITVKAFPQGSVGLQPFVKAFHVREPLEFNL